MSVNLNKSIFISYVDADKAVAQRVKNVLETLINEKVWVREFELRTGGMILDTVDQAISDIRWFVIIYSTSVHQDRKAMYELYMAVTRWMNKEDINIAIIKIDQVSYIKPFNTLPLIAKEFVVTTRLEDAIFELADNIEKSVPVRSDSYTVFEGRGNDLDKFMISARKKRIIFIYGIAGIGKSTFAEIGFAQRIGGKRPRIVRLNQGQSGDYLMRQILKRYFVEQPITTDESILAEVAINAIQEDEDKFYLIINDAQYGLDVNNYLLPYLSRFLTQFVNRDIDTHIIINTTRTLPLLPPEISGNVDIYNLRGLESVYILECIKIWLKDFPDKLMLVDSPEMSRLIEIVDGHPLAATMLVTSLKGNTTPSQLLKSRGLRQMRLSWAQFVLRSVVRSSLNDLETLILHILAQAGQPLNMQDMLAVNELQAYSLDMIYDAMERLSDLLLIRYEGELISIYHSFIEGFYRDQLTSSGAYNDRLNRIATDLGMYTYTQAKRLYSDLEEYPDLRIQKAGEIFRYATSATKLLRMVGEDERASELPMQIQGTLREMVFFFYQKQKNYKIALDYADRWLRISPNDLEIMLYKVRCHRNLQGQLDLQKAEDLISHIEKYDFNDRFYQRVLREKAIIADAKGQRATAISHYKAAIKLAPHNPYPEVYTGLAYLLMNEVDNFETGDLRKRKVAEDVRELLNIARNNSTDFDNHHLGLYIEILIECGEYQRAIELLDAGLLENPHDEKLQFKRAELYRQEGDYDNAENCARQAIDLGSSPAQITLANVLCHRATALPEGIRQSLLEEALQHITLYRRKEGVSPYRLEVAAGVEAKVYRIMGRWENAESVLRNYEKSVNPYTIYEQSRVDQRNALILEMDQMLGKAHQAITQAIVRIEQFRQRYEMPSELGELFSELLTKQKELSEQIEGKW